MRFDASAKSAITNPNSEIASVLGSNLTTVKPDETKWETKIFAGGAVIAKEGATGPHWMTSDPVIGTTATWRKIDNDWLTSVEETEPFGQKIYNADAMRDWIDNDCANTLAEGEETK